MTIIHEWRTALAPVPANSTFEATADGAVEMFGPVTDSPHDTPEMGVRLLEIVGGGPEDRADCLRGLAQVLLETADREDRATFGVLDLPDPTPVPEVTVRKSGSRWLWEVTGDVGGFDGSGAEIGRDRAEDAARRFIRETGTLRGLVSSAGEGRWRVGDEPELDEEDALYVLHVDHKILRCTASAWLDFVAEGGA